MSGPATAPRRPGRPRVYAAHPITCYGTEHERACLDAIGAAFPRAEIVNPATRYSTTAGWLRAWPRLLPTLSVLALFADGDGCVGAGCMHEVIDAARLGVPVVLLDEGSEFRELASFDLLAYDERDACRMAWPVGGAVAGRIALGELGMDAEAYRTGCHQGRYDAMCSGSLGPDDDGEGAGLDGYRHGWNGAPA